MTSPAPPERLNRIFVVAGMPRAGTTLLFHNMERHPAVFTPIRKELDFYTLHFDRGIPWYLDYFAGMPAEHWGCDISPVYGLVPGVAQRMRDANPEVKIIIGVRDPVQGVLSMYAQLHTVFWTPLPFAEFITSYRYERGGRSLVVELQGSGAVPVRIEEYRAIFGDQLLLYNFAQLQRDPLSILQALEAFVGLPAFFTADTAETGVVNASNRRRIKVLSYLTTRETTARLVSALVPRALVGALRSGAARFARNDASRPAPPPDRDTVALAERAFSEQRAYVEQLFADGDLLLGTGRPFPQSAPRADG